MSALFSSRITIKDPEKFREYLDKSKAIAGQHGAELLASATAPRALAGNPAPHQMVVVVRFPTMDALNAWYDSQAYQDLIPLRLEASEQEITVYQTTA
ncbi:MAG: DUF1330 domain-containing protein [Dinoroseobacter sp.]|nr:DUF1330 domain-containing protein [Dinoroseobacter sp.]